MSRSRKVISGYRAVGCYWLLHKPLLLLPCLCCQTYHRQDNICMLCPQSMVCSMEETGSLSERLMKGELESQG